MVRVEPVALALQLYRPGATMLVPFYSLAASVPFSTSGVSPTQIAALRRSDDRFKVRAGAHGDRKSTRLNSSHSQQSRMPSSA